MQGIIKQFMQYYQPKTQKLVEDPFKFNTYAVAQDAYMSALPNQKKHNIATSNLMSCVGFSIRNPDTDETTLAHIQPKNILDLYFKYVIKPQYSGKDSPMEIALVGGEFGTSDNIVRQIYKNMLDIGDFVVTHLDLGWDLTPKYMCIDMLTGNVVSKESNYFLGPDWELSINIKSIKAPKKFRIF